MHIISDPGKGENIYMYLRNGFQILQNGTGNCNGGVTSVGRLEEVP